MTRETKRGLIAVGIFLMLVALGAIQEALWPGWQVFLD